MRSLSLHHIILSCLLLVNSSPSAQAQEELCSDFLEIDPLKECQTVQTYGALVTLLETSPTGTQLNLCPFFLTKAESVATALVQSGIQVRCIRRMPDDACVISGQGVLLWIDTMEPTLWQGFSFRNSNKHAVYISGETENSELAIHTFCFTSFVENIRFEDTRGGALMIEPMVGTVNVVDSLFSENFSKTYGAGIYARGLQLNVINSIFIKNRSNGYGPAIFTATGTSLMIQGSTFLSNKGRDSLDIVFNGELGTEIYVDGLGNIHDDDTCAGTFNLATSTCIKFEQTLPTDTSTAPVASIVTTFPMIAPTAVPRATSTPPTVVVSTNPPGTPIVVTTASPTNTAPSPNRTEQPSVAPQASIPVPTEMPVLPVVPATALPTTPPQTAQPSSATQDTGGPLCTFSPFVGECIQVGSFDDFKAAIIQGGPEVVFCGAFILQKVDLGPFLISRDVDIRCLEKCSLFGTAPYLEIGGTMTQIRIHNMMFQNAADASAVRVSTVTSLSTTTFCETEFAANLANGGLGGAIAISPNSGLVHIVRSSFTGNSAVRGGAIYSDGKMLNIMDSRFVYNKATNTGSAIYMGDGSHVAISGTSFVMNSVEMAGMQGGSTGETDFVITVNPSMSIREGGDSGKTIDDGGNSVIMSGNCEGFWDVSGQECLLFETGRR